LGISAFLVKLSTFGHQLIRYVTATWIIWLALVNVNLFKTSAYYT